MIFANDAADGFFFIPELISVGVFNECDGVAKENLYNGQWQNDKQR